MDLLLLLSEMIKQLPEAPWLPVDDRCCVELHRELGGLEFTLKALADVDVVLVDSASVVGAVVALAVLHVGSVGTKGPGESLHLNKKSLHLFRASFFVFFWLLTCLLLLEGERVDLALTLIVLFIMFQ